MQHVRSGWRTAAMALTLGLAGLSSPAQAALFGGDDEARRAILDLRQRLEQSQNATRALIEQNAQSQTQSQNQATAQLRSALLDLQGQIDRLKSELAQSLGAQERLARDLTELQLRQKDVLSAVDDRLRRFEPVAATIDGREVMVDPAEKTEFEKAMAWFRQADFPAAQTALSSFLLRYGSSAYVPSTLFWLGNAQYANKAYKESMANFQKLLSMAPNHPRAAEAMLAISNVQIELKDMKAARKTLEDLIAAYPQAETAGTARERLSRLR
jgi:tol-pal system protein YbgF